MICCRDRCLWDNILIFAIFIWGGFIWSRTLFFLLFAREKRISYQPHKALTYAYSCDVVDIAIGLLRSQKNKLSIHSICDTNAHALRCNILQRIGACAKQHEVTNRSLDTRQIIFASFTVHTIHIECILQIANQMYRCTNHGSFQPTQIQSTP